MCIRDSVYTVGRMKIKGNLKIIIMDIPEQALRIRNQIGIPRPSCPTTFISGLSISYVPVPIHIQNHYIGRNLIILDFRHNPAVVICRISRVFAIPISCLLYTSSFDYPFNVIQLIQRFERLQVVDIEIQYFVAYLA